MCETCGCSDDSKPRLINLQSGQTLAIDSDQTHEHHHPEGHQHGHTHHHHHGHPADHSHGETDHAHGATIHLETEILAKNNRLAERNRGWFAGRRILALNLVSAPGAGKTSLLERTLRELSGELTLSVIEGDQETINDARRIQATGCRVVQINTGTGCHLDASMVARSLEQLDPPMNSVVMIENVGNLVCPALFDLGEHARVVIASVTEGDDKPVKYPHIFKSSDLVLLNKVDLLPHVPFDVGCFTDHLRLVNPSIRVLPVSAVHGDGLADWYHWLRERVAHRSQPA